MSRNYAYRSRRRFVVVRRRDLGGGAAGGAMDGKLVDAWGSRYLNLNRGSLRQPQWREVAEAVNSRPGASARCRPLCAALPPGAVALPVAAIATAASHGAPPYQLPPRLQSPLREPHPQGGRAHQVEEVPRERPRRRVCLLGAGGEELRRRRTTRAILLGRVVAPVAAAGGAAAPRGWDAGCGPRRRKQTQRRVRWRSSTTTAASVARILSAGLWCSDEAHEEEGASEEDAKKWEGELAKANNELREIRNELKMVWQQLQKATAKLKFIGNYRHNVKLAHVLLALFVVVAGLMLGGKTN
ncbi:uncharacterized protein LOC106804218 [Setaria italica]|uniref:uncharacterized protein LOC106804218 n=1 Tax=Setaria italica TaxID=4555 RepID=UPI0007199D44|nr:uncharacterized protein LOC106804218 [Setaria italica]